jgi:multidrug efflux pump subunit AcrA (membrane-fusion protein)
MIILVFIILASLFTSQYSYADQNDETKDTKEKSNLKTVKVQIGDFIEKSSLKNMELMPLKGANLSISEPEGNLVKFMVNWGEIVKKDQPLMSYTIPVDELVLEEKEMMLKKNEENFKKASEQKELDIAENLSKLMTMNGSSLEAQILKLNIQKMQISYEQYIYQTQKGIDKQRKELEELEANKELKYIKAPYDGIIYGFDNRMEKGTILDPGMDLIYIADINSAVLQAESAGVTNMWYNLDVTINPINDKKENTAKSFKGKVIAIDTLLNGEAKTGMIYIKPESLTEEMASPGQRANITANAIEVKNVLIIPSTAVKADKGLKYVYILDSDGEVRKQYISGRDNGAETWVYNGLSEGQEIVIE